MKNQNRKRVRGNLVRLRNMPRLGHRWRSEGKRKKIARRREERSVD